MDPIVVAGAAMAAGGIFLVAPVEVGVAFIAIAILLVLRTRDVPEHDPPKVLHYSRERARELQRGPWGLLLLAASSLAFGACRAHVALNAYERAEQSADAILPRTSRCSGAAHVESLPERVHGALRWSGTLRDAQCDGNESRTWSGRVTLYGGPDDVARGDDVDVVAQIAPPNRLWNDSDPRPSAARQDSLRSGGIVFAHVVRRGTGLLASIDRVRARVRARIDATFPDDTNAMARALVLGESDLAADDDVAMRASGLAHLLAVSGMHLVIAVLGLVGVLRAFLVRTPFLVARYDVGRLSAALGVPLAWVYAELAGAGGSTRRAAWMVTVGFVARAIGRRTDATRAFGWSLLAMALSDAFVAFDASFALSAGATAGLLCFARPLSAHAESLPKPLHSLARSAATTLAATIPCAPLLARFAPTLPLGGVVANLLAVPVGESLALPLCLGHALLAWWPAAERGTACVSSGALRLVRFIARGFANAHALSLPIPPPTSWQLVATAVAFAAFLLAPRPWRASVIAACVAVLLVAELGARVAGKPHGLLRVTFLDVGQGDAALVDLPDGTAALIDGGGLVGSPVDTGNRVIAPALRVRRRDSLALAVLTHPHPDHYTGLASGLTAVRVGALWDTGQGERESVGGAYATLLESLRGRGVPVVRPTDFCGPHVLGGARVEALAPCPDSRFDRDPNDNSIVLRIAYGSRAFLFVGDAEHAEEDSLLALGSDRLRADVLKVGHHGSRTSSSPAFLAAVGPREAVVSCGARNRFGHPALSTLEALAAAGVRLWRTDHDGAVTIATDGRDLRITTAAGTEARAVDGERTSL